MTQKNKTPLLKGFTIKAYTGSVPSDSEASLRRAAGEKDTGTEVTDPPYFPPTPPNPTDPDAGGGNGEEAIPEIQVEVAAAPQVILEVALILPIRVAAITAHQVRRVAGKSQTTIRPMAYLQGAR